MSYQERRAHLEGLIAMANISELQIQDFDIEIKADGRWFHEGGEIKRIGLVKLFASVLSCDDEGRYWLTTPVEKGEIQVEDAPFVIQSMRVEGAAEGQEVFFTDNLGVEHALGAQRPLFMQKQGTKDPKPYLRLEKGLTARIKHAVFYEMAEQALNAETKTEQGQVALWSAGMLFALEA